MLVVTNFYISLYEKKDYFHCNCNEINPFIDINYIPPTFIPVEQKSEKDDENEQEENASYNSMKQMK